MNAFLAKLLRALVILNLIIGMPALAADPAGTVAAPAANAPAAPAIPPAIEPGATSDALRTTTATPRSAERELLAAYAAGQLGSEYIELGDDTPFIGRFHTPAREPVNGAVLFIGAHGQLVSADPLAAALLREFGSTWAVLVAQMPLLAPTSEIAAYVETEAVALKRVRLALAYLAEAGYDTVVVGQGNGATLLNEYLSAGATTGIRAFAVVGPWQGSLGDVTVPVLEVTDTALVRGPAKKHDTVREVESGRYERLLVEVIDSEVASFNDEIATRIRGWAKRSAIVKPH